MFLPSLEKKDITFNKLCDDEHYNVTKLLMQLKRFDEALAESRKLRKDGGYSGIIECLAQEIAVAKAKHEKAKATHK